MSHFALLVVTPTEADLDATLQPYHEFECTGTDDQYVQDIDETEEYLSNYETYTETVWFDPEGNRHKPYDEEFYRDPTPEEQAEHRFNERGSYHGMGGNGKISWSGFDKHDGRGYRTYVRMKVEELAGWREEERPIKERLTFVEFVDYWSSKPLVASEAEINLGSTGERGDPNAPHKYGYCLAMPDGSAKVINRTNPNKRWDYWSIGGRYDGKLIKKTGEVVDQARKSELDWEAMRRKVYSIRYGAVRDYYAKIRTHRPGITDAEIATMWQDYVAKNAAARKAWEELPEGTEENPRSNIWDFIDQYPRMEEYTAIGIRDMAYGWGWTVPLNESDPMEWCENAPPLTALSYLDADGWVEKGTMGWWGVIHDEKDSDVWEEMFNKKIASIPDDYVLTLVDCHI